MKIHLIAALCTAFLLSACGGGGGSGDDSGPIDKYVGNWKGTCDTRGDIFDTADDRPTSVIDSVKFSKLTSTTANVETTTTVYASSDIACTGAPIGTIVKTGQNSNTLSLNASGITSSFGQNIWTYNDNVALAAGRKVDQINHTESKFSTIENETLTGGRVKIDTTLYGALTVKAIAYFVDANTAVFNFNDPDQGYPTVLTQDQYTTYIKQ